MDVRAVLVVLLMFTTTAKAAQGNVEFWRKEFTMTCPQEGTWTIQGQAAPNNTKSYTLIYDGKNNGVHYCSYKDNDDNDKDVNYYFYVKGKVCENCFELDAKLFLLVIIVDIIATAFVMMMIYRCTERKSSAGSKKPYKTPSRSGGPAPPTPSRDYETLNVHTRSQDTYSTVNRTG